MRAEQKSAQRVFAELVSNDAAMWLVDLMREIRENRYTQLDLIRRHGNAKCSALRAGLACGWLEDHAGYLRVTQDGLGFLARREKELA